MRKLSNRAFTLIEVLVGSIVIAAISLSAWTAMTVLTKTSEMSRNRSIAVNLLQQSQEEIRRIAQVDATFDTLATCQFPGPATPPVTCGLADTTVTFPEHTRTMNVTLEGGSPELKRVLTTVQWTENGRAQQVQSVMLLSRPPEPLPGNILGLVSSTTQPGVPLSGIPINIAFTTSTATYSTTSAGTVDGAGANFDFAEVGTGKYLLPTGDYSLTVTASGYFPYTHPTNVTVGSNSPTFVSFELQPLPEDATITGRVVYGGTSTTVASFNIARVHLHDDGSRQGEVVNQSSYSFTIPFTDSLPKTFSVNTWQAYRAGYVFQVNSGGAPSCNFTYNREGYSTAVVQADTSLICSNPYFGNAASDRLTVMPGDNLVVDLSVIPVPEITITGRVVDSDLNPIANATVRARWPRSTGSTGYDWRRDGGSIVTATSQADGTFSFNVPVVQEMFPNSNPSQNYLRVWARGQVSIVRCCDNPQTVTRNSALRLIGPLDSSQDGTDFGDFIISKEDEDCGDVGGNIIDDLTTNSLDNVDVNISATDVTDAVGRYDIVCPPAETGFRLRRGSYRFRGTRSGYYQNDSNGNNQYARRTSNGRDVYIQTDTKIEYDARMWPRGFGNIEVTVLDQTTGLPMDGVDVRFSPYSGSSTTLTTVAGDVTFTALPETWPPPGLPNDGYYRTNSRTHTISINHDPANYLPATQVIPNLNDGDTLSITIMLQRVGGV